MVDGTPCVLDIEASGFGGRSYPIEIGFVLPDGRGVCTLVRPPDHWTHWDPAAEAVHGIQRMLLLRHGRPVTEVARLLNEGLADRTVYSDGWANDYVWLARLFDEAGVAQAFRLEHLRCLLSEAEAERFAAVRTAVEQRTHLGRHRASSDARVLQQAVAELRAQRQGTPAHG